MGPAHSVSVALQPGNSLYLPLTPALILSPDLAGEDEQTGAED